MQQRNLSNLGIRPALPHLIFRTKVPHPLYCFFRHLLRVPWQLPQRILPYLLPAAILPPQMIPIPPKTNQTAIAILMTINQQFFRFSFAHVWNMSAMIGHLGNNEQFYGGEHFRYFSNLTTTWIKNSPLGGLNLWILSINHANDHLGSTFPTHVGTKLFDIHGFHQEDWTCRNE